MNHGDLSRRKRFLVAFVGQLWLVGLRNEQTNIHFSIILISNSSQEF